MAGLERCRTNLQSRLITNKGSVPLKASELRERLKKIWSLNLRKCTSKCCTLPKNHSDHNLLMFSCDRIVGTMVKPFNFLGVWTNNESCRRSVYEHWNKIIVRCLMFVLSLPCFDLFSLFFELGTRIFLEIFI